MSTVMYCFKLPKSKLWPFVDEVKKFYGKEGFGTAYLDNLTVTDSNFYQKWDEIEKRKESLEVKLQLFDKKGYWLFRVLEDSFLFLNNWEKFPYIQSCFYDNRTDIPKEHRGNKKIARWVDEEISRRHYMIIYIEDIELLKMRFIENVRLSK